MSQSQKASSSSQTNTQQEKKLLLDNERIEQIMAQSIGSIVMTSDNRAFQSTCMEMIQKARDCALARAVAETDDDPSETYFPPREAPPNKQIVDRSNAVMHHLYMDLLKKLKYNDLL